MLSVVVCSISQERLLQLSQNIKDTIGTEYEIIAVDNRDRKWPIARAYNWGASQAKYPYVFFVHEDVKFHTCNWGDLIEEKLVEPDCGVIGFAGSKVKLKCYSGWVHDPKWAYSLLYQKRNELTMLEAYNVFKEHSFEEVVALDGFGLFVRKELWAIYPFDEKALTGFHCYDLDFSLQIAVTEKYKNYVCCSLSVLVEHSSSGNYNQSWYEDTIRMHRLKWNKFLPIIVSGYNISKKEEKLFEERSFNQFLLGLLKTQSSQKKTVLKEFLAYPFSFKHIGHCISNIYKYFKS